MWQLIDGFIHYIDPEQTIALSAIPLHNGKWHNVLITWSSGKITVSVDYGQRLVRFVFIYNNERH